MLLDLEKLYNKHSLKINGVIHIGGHFGQEYDVYKKLKIKNMMFFEPSSNSFNVLQKKIGNKAVLVNRALGNQEGEIEMFIESANEGQSNSILKPALHLLQYPHIKFNEKELVKITRLDNYISESKKYNFINIDVQGYELEVFKGAEKFLHHIDYINTEVNIDEVYKDCAMIEDLDEFLSSYNFIRVETSMEGGIWGDSFYIKNDKLRNN